MSEWDDVKKFVNNNDLFTRKLFYESGLSSTGEQYLILIRRIGFIERIDIATHKRIYKIPDSLTTSKIRKLLNNHTACLKYMRSEKLNQITKNLFTN